MNNMNYMWIFPDKWENEDLIVEGLANVSEAPSVITDIGMRAVGVCFPRIKHLDIYNCPHILRPTQWFTQGICLHLSTVCRVFIDPIIFMVNLC